MRALVCLAMIASLGAAVPAIAQNANDGPSFDWRGEAPLGEKQTAPPLIGSSAVRPLPDVCALIGKLLPNGADETNSSEAACLFSEGAFFVIARAEGGTLSNIRFKLNSSTQTQDADLRQLGQLVGSFHRDQGWAEPATVTAAISSGGALICQSGPLRYSVSKERDEIPRFNVVIRVDRPSENFGTRLGQYITIC